MNPEFSAKTVAELSEYQRELAAEEAAIVAAEQEVIALPRDAVGPDPEDHLFKLYFAAKEHVRGLEEKVEKAAVEIAWLNGVIADCRTLEEKQAESIRIMLNAGRVHRSTIRRLEDELEKESNWLLKIERIDGDSVFCVAILAAAVVGLLIAVGRWLYIHHH